MTNKLYEQAAAHWRAQQPQAAARLLRQLVAEQPEFAPGWHLLGLTAERLGETAQAIECLNRAGQLAPDNGEIQSHRAEMLRRAGQLDDALAAARRSIHLQPDSASAYNNLGLILAEQGAAAEAEAAYERAILTDPAYPRAWYNLASLYFAQERLADAKTALEQAIRRRPAYPQALLLMGMLFSAQDDVEGGLPYFQQAARLAPTDPKVPLNHANALLKAKRYDEALDQLRRALTLQPDYPEAHLSAGLALEGQRRFDGALATYQRLLQRRPDWAEAHFRLGRVLNELNRLDEARAAYRHALTLQPDYPEAAARLLWMLSILCDWDELAHWLGVVKEATAQALAAGQPAPLAPFQANAYDISMAEKRAIARSHAGPLEARLTAPRARLAFTHPAPEANPPRLRIGYLSFDFRNHAVGHLTRSLFGLHDRAHFEVFVYSYGPDDGSDYRQTIAAESEHFIDLWERDDEACARRIHADGIHILVDLMGWVPNCRPEIAGLRPAPVQVNYLGYPGTTAVDFMDYLISDRMVSPPEQADWYSEKVVYLPHAYQVNDYRQPIADAPVLRADEGLPERGFVFCCFCDPYKIDPLLFGVWMEILHRTPGSVLWLMSKYEVARRNLRREADRHGVDPQRLIFAESKPKPQHLARLQLADLCLDTRFYNGHTTASDALWAGVPVITSPGEGFTARVAASLLAAVGLPDLITADLADYQQAAIHLGNDPAALAALKSRLAENRKTHPLFDTPRFVRDLETLYAMMWADYSARDSS